MKHLLITVATVALLSACAQQSAPQLSDESDPIDVLDASDLTDIMLTVSDPEEAVRYFRNALSREPERLEFKRGLAESLVKARQYSEAALLYERIIENGDSEYEDRLLYAKTLVLKNQFAQAEEQLAEVPNSAGGWLKSMLLGMIADQDQRWADADGHYRLARSQTNRPSQVLVNWGTSMQARGDFASAEKTFTEAITYDPTNFEAKNNLVITRGLQGNYNLPVVPMSEEERATFLHNLALVALRKGEINIAKGLLERAVEEHPRYFAAAAEKLEGLSGSVQR